MSPIVPRRSDSYLPTAPLPGFVAPAAPVDISPVTKLVSGIQEEEQQKADHTAILGADAQLAQVQNTLLYDPQIGAMNVRGQAAAQAHRDAMDAWTKSSSKIEVGLSENQKLAFRKVAQARTQDFDRALAQHADTEIQRSILDTSQANIDSERSLTLQNFAKFGDLARVQQGIDHQRNALTLAAPLLGDSPEVTSRKIAEEVSTVHSGVLNVMIAKDQDLAASKYLQDHLTELEPGALAEMQKHVDLSSLRGESQRRSDSILASTATLSGAIAEARKIEDPQLRDATEERLTRSYQIREADDRQVRDDAFQRAGQVLRQTGDLNKIAPADWLKLSPEEQIQLHHLDGDQRRPTQTGDSDLFMSLMNMSSLSGTRDNFIHTDLTPLKAKLSDKQYAQVLRRQLTLRDEANRAVKKGPSAQSKAFVDSLMRRPGTTPVVPGAPLRAPTVSTRSSGNIDLGVFQSAPHLSQRDLDAARRDPRYRKFLADSAGIKIP